ncbi:MAG: DUF805 domain-containing protein [Propionicimonas sp.]
MTDLYSQNPSSQTLAAGPAPTDQPDLPVPRRFTLAQSARSLRRAPVKFSGRVARSEFWWSQLLLVAVTGILSLLIWLARVVGGSLAVDPVLDGLEWIALVSLLVITIGLGSRRLHDAGRSGWLQLLVLIPLVGWIALLVMLLFRGTPRENRHGPVSLPVGTRRSGGVVALTIAGLAAALALGVAVFGTSTTAALGPNAAGVAGTSFPLALISATPEPAAPIDPTITAQQVGGCWSTYDARGMIEPVACDASNAGYVVTAVVDEGGCPGASVEGQDPAEYLCLAERE